MPAELYILQTYDSQSGINYLPKEETDCYSSHAADRAADKIIKIAMEFSFNSASGETKAV